MGNYLEIYNISKSYGTDTVLTDISLAVEKGTAIAITGESGGGKTTLLSIMGLLQRPTEGQVMVDGDDAGVLNQPAQAAIRSRFFGFIFQRTRLVNSLTALENVLVPAWIARKGRSMDKKAYELLYSLGLEHRLHFRPQELSLGQLRRVALARALLLSPPVILADEPTNDLDPIMAGNVATALFKARDKGASVILVTHDHGLAWRADKVYKLQDGRLVPEKP